LLQGKRRPYFWKDYVVKFVVVGVVYTGKDEKRASPSARPCAALIAGQAGSALAHQEFHRVLGVGFGPTFLLLLILALRTGHRTGRAQTLRPCAAR
jgi:hypothetical protein